MYYDSYSEKAAENHLYNKYARSDVFLYLKTLYCPVSAQLRPCDMDYNMGRQMILASSAFLFTPAKFLVQLFWTYNISLKGPINWSYYYYKHWNR